MGDEKTVAAEQQSDRAVGCSCLKLLVGGAGLLIVLSVAAWFSFNTLSENFHERVHAGMTRAEIEAYLGEPTGRMESTGEIPPEDRHKFDLPDHPAPGGIVSYDWRGEPAWLGNTPVGLHMRMWNSVFVYYDEDDIAIEVHVRNFS